MRLSLWTQYSSNHSAAFSIVGTFESPEWAQEVANELTQLFIDTQRWADDEALDENPAVILQNLRYDVSLGSSWMLDRQHVRRAVTVIDRYLLVTDHPGYCNDISYHTIMQIIRALNGRIVASLDGGEYCNMTLQCSALDDETMARILDNIVKLERHSQIDYYPKNHLPWHWFARVIQPDGLTLLIDGIRVSDSGFGGVFEWIDFLKGYRCTDFKIQLYGYPEDAEPSGWIPMDVLDVRRPFWAQFPHRGDKNFEPDMRVVLAQFASPSAASEAAAKVRAILQTVTDWIDQNPEQAKWVWEAFWERLSPPEVDLKAKYGVRWRYSIVEWLHPLIRLRPADDVITVIGSTLLLANRRDTWVGIEPFHELLPQLGASMVHVTPEVRGQVACDMRVTIRDEQQIAHIMAAIEERNTTTLPLWYRYYGGAAQDDAWWQAGMDALAYQAQVAAALERLQQFWLSHKGQFDAAEKIRHVQERLLAHVSETGYAAAHQRIQDMRFTVDAVVRHKYDLLLKGVQFHIEFNPVGTLQGLLALAAWLRASGDAVTIALYRRMGQEREDYFEFVLGD
jgi:hypothetical protein